MADNNNNIESGHIVTLERLQEVFNDFKTNVLPQIRAAIETRVKKVNGKGLSTEDFTSSLLTKLTQLYTKAEIDALLQAMRTGLYVPVQTLPTASTETMFKIYLVPSANSKTRNVKDEYITVATESEENGETVTTYDWEQIGSTTVNLSGYSTTTEMNAAITAAMSAVAASIPTIEDFHEAVATLQSAPTSSTLTYQRDGQTYNYKVGDEVRVADSESGTEDTNNYVFYKLYDLVTSGNTTTAYWALAGAGGSESANLSETVTITLTSNQAQPDSSLEGATITVTDIDEDETLLSTQWAGTAIQLQITPGTNYRISVGQVSGYATPAVQDYTARLQNTRSAEFAYNTTVLTVSAVTNQDSHTDVSGVQINVGGTKVNNGGYIKVPTGSSVTITFPQVEGYATPDSQTITASGVTQSVTGTYNTTVHTVTMTSNQSNDSVIGALQATVAFAYGGQNYSYQKSNGQTVKVPTSTTPTITFPDSAGYRKTVTDSGASHTAAYETEVTTITVGTDQTGVTAEGQNITINGSVYAVGASGTVTAKVPFGTQYTVSADAKSGYSSPATQTFTASQSSRAVSMTYTKIVLGVFILDTAGGLTTASAWGSSGKTLSDVVGIAVLTADHKFVIAPEDLGSKQINNTQKACSGATAITDQTQAKQHFDGAGNTAKMVSSYGSGSTYAAGAAAAYSKGGKSWYLPSLGEMQTAYDNKAAIDAALTACGATAMNTSAYHWTSTYYGPLSGGFLFWRLKWSDGRVDYGNVNYSYQVRPFCAF